MKQKFTHLHLHTEYSILDGVGQTKRIVNRAAEIGAESLAITDHGTVSGHIVFQTECLAKKIKPIFGCEFYTCENIIEKKNRHKNHVVLLAKNEEGYKNLMKLISIASTDGFYYKPRIDFSLLKKYHNGLVCMTACIGGEIPQAIIKNDIDSAVKVAEKYKDLFGEDFYLEIQPNKLPQQKYVNIALVELAKALKIEIVCTNDVHYPYKDDWKAHEIVLCIKTKTPIKNHKRFKFGDNSFFLMTDQEIFQAFQENHLEVSGEVIEKAMQNSLVIAKKCNYVIKKKKVVLPTFNLPNEFLETGEYLDFLAKEGLKKDYVVEKIKKHAGKNGLLFSESYKIYKDRLDQELKIIYDLSFERYVLIVWEIYQFAKKAGISYGPGRGSVAGSLLAYIIGITVVDPIENDLLFSRFLTPQRLDYPDIDMDFEDTRRQEIVQHLKDLYGEDKVANIVTFGRMQGKAVVKDVARVFSVPYGEVNRITEYIVPNPDGTLFETVHDSIKTSLEVKEFAKKYPEVIKYAEILEGQVRQRGKHAAGIVISQEPFWDICPIEKNKKSIITSFDKDAVEEIGLLKLDILGLKTMSIIKQTLENIKQTTKKEISLEKISLDDPEVFQDLTDGQTAGVFQLDTKLMRRLCRRVKITSFEDIISITALGRPGTMRSGLTEKYIRVKNQKEKPLYVHPMMTSITEPTYSILLFQEQIMRVLADIGSFGWEDVDRQRKIIAKSKGSAKFEKARAKFITGAIKNNVDEMVANQLYDEMAEAGGYSFNKSHAAAYSTLSFWCAWLKHHYPNEFFAAALSRAEGKEKEFVREARKLGVKVLPPDINQSETGFSLSGNNILGGFDGIKGLGERGIENIIKNRPYKDFQDFERKVSQSKVHKSSVEILLKIGAFGYQNTKEIYDNYKAGRSALQRTFSNFQEKVKVSKKWTKEDFAKSQEEFYVLPPVVHSIEEYNDFINTLEISSEYSLISELDLEEKKGKTVWIRGVIIKKKMMYWGSNFDESPEKSDPLYNHYHKYPLDAEYCLLTIEDETGSVFCSVDPTHYQEIKVDVGLAILVKGKGGFYLTDRITSQEIYDLESFSKAKTFTKKQQDLLESPLKKYAKVKQTSLAKLEKSGSTIGIFGRPKLHIDKRGKEMAFVPFSDLTGEITIIFFADDWDYRKKIVQSGQVAGVSLERLSSKDSYTTKKIVLLQ